MFSFTVSLIVSLPFAIFFRTMPAEPGQSSDAEDCKEVWPEPNHVYKKASIIVVVFTTYVVPLAVIIFCYARILKTLWNKRLASGVSYESLRHLRLSLRSFLKTFRDGNISNDPLFSSTEVLDDCV